METTPEIRLTCPVEIKFAVVDRFKDYARDHYQNCIDIDGVRFEEGESWGLVRPSNTQPVIVLRFEAADAGELAKIQSETTEKLGEIMRAI
jgi:phosphomannomutase/phosphoglucomutase